MYVAIESHSAVAFAFARSNELAGSEVLQTISQYIRVGIAEHKGSEFHDANESRQVEDFCIGISAIKNARKVKQFGACIYFGPESLFQRFFGRTECGGWFD
jgi:hypothetical protein